MKKGLYPVILLLLVLCSCSDADSEEKIVIMSWNVQNFFDDVDNGTEYREYDPANGDWNYDGFSRKSSVIADVITSSVVGGPDIVLLQEVENENALQHLNSQNLKASGYRYLLFLPTEDSAIGCGVLSRYPIAEARSHAVNFEGRVSGRNISELDIILDGTDAGMKIFVNHWKSKLGGAEQTEPARIAAAGMLNRLMTDSCLVDPELMVLAAGDFNESHDEFSRIEGLYPTAIIGGTLSGDSEKLFYNPWCENQGGSYCYNGMWETIDQFFLNKLFFDGAGWDYEGFGTVILDFNSTADGLPLKWQASSVSGCSDHFPILLRLKPIR